MDNNTVSFSSNVNILKDFPCIVVKGMEYDFEVEYFTKKKFEEEGSLPFYLEYEGEFIRLKKLDLNHKVLLELYTIDKNYKVCIYKSEKDKIELDLSNPETILKFVKY